MDDKNTTLVMTLPELVECLKEALNRYDQDKTAIRWMNLRMAIKDVLRKLIESEKQTPVRNDGSDGIANQMLDMLRKKRNERIPTAIGMVQPDTMALAYRGYPIIRDSIYPEYGWMRIPWEHIISLNNKTDAKEKEKE